MQIEKWTVRSGQIETMLTLRSLAILPFFIHFFYYYFAVFLDFLNDFYNSDGHMSQNLVILTTVVGGRVGPEFRRFFHSGSAIF